MELASVQCADANPLRPAAQRWRISPSLRAQVHDSASYSPAAHDPPPRFAGTLDGSFALRPAGLRTARHPQWGPPDVRLAAPRRLFGGSPASPALSPRPLRGLASLRARASHALNEVRSSGPANASHRFARWRSRTARFGPGGPAVAPRSRGAAEARSFRCASVTGGGARARLAPRDCRHARPPPRALRSRRDP